MKYYLAIDIGASSGICILGHQNKKANKIVTEEVYRFENILKKRKQTVYWDINAFMGHILTGMKKCVQLGKIPESVGITTWGVDFVLLDKDGKIIGDPVSYRDERTTGMDKKVHKIIPEAEYYSRTGINKYTYNTIYQLMAIKTKTPELFDKAQSLLFIPDYLHYRLCGVQTNEFTVATTSGLINTEKKDWDYEIISKCGFPEKLFLPLHKPGTIMGFLTEKIQSIVGYNCKVILPPAHDTASAFFSVSDENHIVISSGTWSIVGVTIQNPILTENAYKLGFTNESAADGRIRFLKNVMGLWMIQSVRKELGGSYYYTELSSMAEESNYEGLVDVNDNCFFAPQDMIKTIKEKCIDGGYPAPKTTGDIILCINRSLAKAYARTVEELIELTGQKFEAITIIGGGSKNTLLNKLTQEECGLPVHIGYAESTAFGNLMFQMG